MKRKMENKAVQTMKKENTEVVGTRGRTFQGIVSKRFDKRAVIEFERTVRIPKYERFSKRKTKLHARIPEGMDIKIGDYVKVRECRPLSKMIHFVVIEIVRKAEGKK